MLIFHCPQQEKTADKEEDQSFYKSLITKFNSNLQKILPTTTTDGLSHF